MLRMEYVDGPTFAEYIKENRNNYQTLLDACQNFRQRLAELHALDICHGDPHLYNVLVTSKDNTQHITLVDFNMLHHPRFALCKEFGCFTLYNRFEADKSGFRRELEALARTLALDSAPLITAAGLR